MSAAHLEPRPHEPPTGWSRETFETVTDAIAAALVAAVRQEREAVEARETAGR